MASRAAGIATVAVLGYLSVCTYMWSTQIQHVFLPSPIIQTTPDRLGMKYEELRIPVGSGADKGDLNAWWVHANKLGAPAVLYLHGNENNIGAHLEGAKRFHTLGLNVLLVDYRGYGKSTGGDPSEVKVYEDAETAWQYLLKQRGVKAQQIFIYGNSLGGAIGIDLAVHHADAAGLIAESTFTSMADMGRLVYGYLPVDLLLNQRFESLEKIPRLRIPVLLIHGKEDKKIPYQMSQQLFAAAPQPKQLVLIEGGEHGNSGRIGWPVYRETVSEFIGKYAR